MKGFRELQIEQTRAVNDGLHHATLFNVTGASGFGTGSPCNTISISTIRNSPDWTCVYGMAGVHEAVNTRTGEIAVRCDNTGTWHITTR